MSDRMIRHLIDHRSEDWAMLQAKYDPTGEYRRRDEERNRLQQNEQQSVNVSTNL